MNSPIQPLTSSVIVDYYFWLCSLALWLPTLSESCEPRYMCMHLSHIRPLFETAFKSSPFLAQVSVEIAGKPDFHYLDAHLYHIRSALLELLDIPYCPMTLRMSDVGLSVLYRYPNTPTGPADIVISDFELREDDYSSCSWSPWDDHPSRCFITDRVRELRLQSSIRAEIDSKIIAPVPKRGRRPVYNTGTFRLILGYAPSRPFLEPTITALQENTPMPPLPACLFGCTCPLHDRGYRQI